MMNWNKTLPSLSILAIAISPTLLGFSSLPSPSPEAVREKEVSLQFPPTGNRSTPKGTVGGGVRSDENSCLSSEEGEAPLVALMPNRENKGKTATATPSLYWYVPQTTATTGELVLTDEANNEVYFTNFSLPSQPGILKLTIPAKASLKPGQTYAWSFMIVCDPQYRNRDQAVEGTIEYVELNSNIQSQLKTATPTDKSKLYADSLIWYETLDIVAQMHEENPQEWQELLKSVGLEILVDKPLLDCCSAEK